MKKIKETFNSLKKKPYKLISLVTLLVFVVGISAFSFIKSNQVKGYFGRPYDQATYGGIKYEIMRLVDKNGNNTLSDNPSNEEYQALIESHQLAEAGENEFGNGVDGPVIKKIPYRYASGKITGADYAINGQYGFIPTWTDGKTKVYYYKDDSPATLASPTIILNDGKIEASSTTGPQTAEITAFTFTDADVKNNAFIKFTYMGMYKNEWIDVVIKPQAIGEGTNSSLSVGYGRSKNNKNSDVNAGSFLTLSNTSAPKSTKSEYYGPDASANKNIFQNVSDVGANVNYVEADLMFYKTIQSSEPNEGADMTNQEKTKVQGFFTYGDFDLNESLGLDKTQIDQIFVLSPNEGDNGFMDVNQNPMIYSYKDATMDSNNNALTFTKIDELKNMDETLYYPKPNTLVKNGEPGYESTLYYLVQRYGLLNNAYTQLMYTYQNTDAVSRETSTMQSKFNSKNFIYFNRGYQSNTNVTAKGGWLSFTYKETDALHIAVNASRSMGLTAPSLAYNTINANSKAMYDDYKATLSDSSLPKVYDIEDLTNSSGTSSVMQKKYTKYKYPFDKNTQDFYVISKIVDSLGYGWPNNYKYVTNGFRNSDPVLSWLSASASGVDYPNFVGNSASSNTGSAVGYVATSMIPILPLDPIKTAEVTKGSSDVEWSVLQNIPVKYAAASATTAKLQIVDELPKYLELKGQDASKITITNLGGETKTNLFDIKYEAVSGKPDVMQIVATAKADELLKDDFYLNSYYLTYTTSVSANAFSNQANADEFNQLYYKKNYEHTNFDGTKTPVNNSYLFLNQAQLLTSKITLDDYNLYSNPVYNGETSDWDKILSDNGGVMPDKYKTPAIVPLTSTSITLTKTGEQADGSQKPLGGAEFKVYYFKKDADGNTTTDKVYLTDATGVSAVYTTATDGTVKITDNYIQDGTTWTDVGIGPDTYYFEEVKAPTGYEAKTTESSLIVRENKNYNITIENDKTRIAGDLKVTKEVQDASGQVITTDVDRGTDLFYVITIMNNSPSSELTRLGNVSLEDKEFKTDYIGVANTAPTMTGVETIGSPTGTFAESPNLVYDDATNTLQLKNSGINLAQQEQIRIKIPITIKDDAKSGPFSNSATSTGEGVDTDGKPVIKSATSNEAIITVKPFNNGELDVAKEVQDASGQVVTDAVDRGTELFYVISIKNNSPSTEVTRLDNIGLVDKEFKHDYIEVANSAPTMTGVEKIGSASGTFAESPSLKYDNTTQILTLKESKITLAQQEQIRIKIPIKIKATAEPGTFVNLATATGDGFDKSTGLAVTNEKESNEASITVKPFNTGSLSLVKEVSANKTDDKERNDLNGKPVNREETLYYTVTVKNTSKDATLLSSISLKDTFDLTKVTVDFANTKISLEEDSSSNPKNPADINNKLPDDSAYDEPNGVLTVGKISLREGKQYRVLIPVTVKKDAPAGTLENIAKGTATDITEIDSNKVTNIIPEQDKPLFVRQIVVKNDKTLSVPKTGYITIENLTASQSAGDGALSHLSVPSGIDAKYKEIVVPYTAKNNTYLFNAIVPQMYEAVGYTAEKSETAGNSTTAKLLNEAFVYSGDDPYYITVYIQPKISKTVPFYNWSYKTNKFGTIK